MNIENEIQKIISNIIGRNIEDFNVSLFDYGLDSFKAIGMIVELEKTFDIRIPDEMLMIDCWETMAKILENVKTIISMYK